jgi:hypothetical protein
MSNADGWHRVAEVRETRIEEVIQMSAETPDYEMMAVAFEDENKADEVLSTLK